MAAQYPVQSDSRAIRLHEMGCKSSEETSHCCAGRPPRAAYSSSRKFHDQRLIFAAATAKTTGWQPRPPVCCSARFFETNPAYWNSVATGLSRR